MTKLSDITSKLKNTKFRVQMTEQAAVDVQKAMFSMGFRHWTTESGTVREVRQVGRAGRNFHAFYIDEDCRILNSCVPGTFGDTPSYREISILAVYEAAQEFKALKIVLKVERQAEKAAARQAALPKKVATLEEMLGHIVADAGGKEVDSEGYIVWKGGECPVSGSTLVEVKFGSTGGYKTEGRMLRWDWRFNGSGGDIAAYRLSSPVKTFAELSDSRCSDALEMAPDTNPKKQFGLTSIPLHLWSPLASAYGALSLYNGSLKYGRNNFKASPVEASIYIGAAMRHLSAWAEGEENDPADGCSNLGGVLANVAILLEARAVGTLIDDRQLPGGYLKERDAMKAQVVHLQEVHAGKDPRHYTIADQKA